MSTYIPLFNRRQSILPVNDFSGFDDISDTEEDDFTNNSNQQQQQQSTSTSQSNNNTRGGITLSNELQDPLTTTLNSQSTSTSSSSSNIPIRNSPTSSLPGGYDFEPQVNESGPSSHSTPRSRSSISSSSNRPVRRNNNNSSNNNNNNNAIVTNNQNRNPFLSLSERLLPTIVFNRLVPNSTSDSREDHGLLFGQEEGVEEELDEDNDEALPRSNNNNNQSTYPPRGTASHIPLPARPPSFVPSGTSGRIFGGGQGNDGVFANLAAKPEGVRRYGGGEFVGGDDAGGDKDEIPPSYEAAALDSTPPYWETTIITPGGILGPDDICVDGLPVGNFFGFAWNMLVSMSFQFVGFLLTYLLHTTHAAKNGSRAGLGITLIQLGLYVKQRAEHPEYMMDGPGDATGLEGSLGGTDSTGTLSWWGSSSDPSGGDYNLATPTIEVIGSIPTQISNALGMGLDSSSGVAGVMGTATSTTSQSLGNFKGEQVMRMSEGANEYMAFFLVILGSFLLVGALLNYWRAVRWARAVRQDMGTASAAV